MTKRLSHAVIVRAQTVRVHIPGAFVYRGITVIPDPHRDGFLICENGDTTHHPSAASARQTIDTGLMAGLRSVTPEARQPGVEMFAFPSEHEARWFSNDLYNDFGLDLPKPTVHPLGCAAVYVPHILELSPEMRTSIRMLAHDSYPNDSACTTCGMWTALEGDCLECRTPHSGSRLASYDPAELDAVCDVFEADERLNRRHAVPGKARAA